MSDQPSHTVIEDASPIAPRDKFRCLKTPAYTHTAAWPTWKYCPYCGDEIDLKEEGGEVG